MQYFYWWYFSTQHKVVLHVSGQAEQQVLSVSSTDPFRIKFSSQLGC
jgi:hypothetical protein